MLVNRKDLSDSKVITMITAEPCCISAYFSVMYCFVSFATYYSGDGKQRASKVEYKSNKQQTRNFRETGL